MATDAQMKANQSNAQHSTGPTSEEGKAVSMEPGTTRIMHCGPREKIHLVRTFGLLHAESNQRM